MMGISPAEAKKLSYWEYQAILSNWNDRHRTDEGEGDEVEAPDADFVEHRHLMLERAGIGKMVH